MYRNQINNRKKHEEEKYKTEVADSPDIGWKSAFSKLAVNQDDELQSRVQKCIGSWKSGKFLPLVCRPFSLNTYCSSKIWFRTSSVDMRAGDILAITSRLKAYCYQDLFQKPSEVLLYRGVEQGGLGLHHIHSKALANLISTFIQTACNKNFQNSLFHSWL